MASVGDFFDEPTDALLNAAAAGRQIPITDPICGRVVMRMVPASVIGTLIVADCASLHHAGPAQLLATVFVPAVPPPIAADSNALITLMRQVRALGDDITTLHLPAQDDALATAAAAWVALAGHALPPLSDFLAGLPDLVRRLAALLHLAAAAGGGARPTPEISPATVKRAVAIVEACVVPAARAVLSPVSAPEVERTRGA